MRYSSPDLAARAIETLNGAELDGRKLHVREDRTYIDSAEGVVVFVVRTTRTNGVVKGGLLGTGGLGLLVCLGEGVVDRISR